MDTHSRCSKCGGLLDGRYNLRGWNFDLVGSIRDSMWQFRDLMPPVSDANIVTFSEGWTPLVERLDTEGQLALKAYGAS